MKPADLSATLRRIASKIDASKNPSRELVLKHLRKLASELTGEPRIEVAIFEGGAYTEHDVVGSLVTNMEPVWASLTPFGWAFMNVDPKMMAPETRMSSDQAFFDGKALESILSHDYVKLTPRDFKEYSSSAKFAAEEDTLRFMCSYDEKEKPAIGETLVEHGFTEAADKLPDVEM